MNKFDEQFDAYMQECNLELKESCELFEEGILDSIKNLFKGKKLEIKTIEDFIANVKRLPVDKAQEFYNKFINNKKLALGMSFVKDEADYQKLINALEDRMSLGSATQEYEKGKEEAATKKFIDKNKKK